MAVLAVVTSSPPGVEGGHLVIARALVAAARAAGHDAHLVVTPDYGFGRFAASVPANWRTDVSEEVGRPVDQVISLRYPSYAVRHLAHVCWLNHTMREYHDLWPRFSGAISPRARVKERVRKALIHAADRWLLTRNVTKVFAQSRTIERRLVAGLGRARRRPVSAAAAACLPVRQLRRLHLRRVAPDAAEARWICSSARWLSRPAVMCGRSSQATAKSVAALESLAATLGVAGRVTFAGRISDEAMLDHLGRCRAVCFAPFDEDYGFVTVEAFASRKGRRDLPRQRRARRARPRRRNRARLRADALVDGRRPRAADGRSALAERLGAAAAVQADAMSWPATVKRLVIV